MAMNLTDGGLREFDDGSALKDLFEQLRPNEVGVFGPLEEVDKLRKTVREANERKKSEK